MSINERRIEMTTQYLYVSFEHKFCSYYSAITLNIFMFLTNTEKYYFY